jgi:plasmid stability protein
MATLNIKNLPDGLYRKLKARAKAERRSVAQEVTRILTEVLEQPVERNAVKETAASAYIDRMAGRATTRLSTDQIMTLTRGRRDQ